MSDEVLELLSELIECVDEASEVYVDDGTGFDDVETGENLHRYEPTDYGYDDVGPVEQLSEGYDPIEYGYETGESATSTDASVGYGTDDAVIGQGEGSDLSVTDATTPAEATEYAALSQSATSYADGYGVSEWSYDDTYGTYINSTTGEGYDPATGMVYDPATGWTDGYSGNWSTDELANYGYADGWTYDSATGMYIDASSGAVYDPMTGESYDPMSGMVYDPTTGLARGYYDSLSGWFTDASGLMYNPHTNVLFDPSTGGMYDATTGLPIDSVTGQPIDDSTITIGGIDMGPAIGNVSYDSTTGVFMDLSTGATYAFDPATGALIDLATGLPVQAPTITVGGFTGMGEGGSLAGSIVGIAGMPGALESGVYPAPLADSSPDYYTTPITVGPGSPVPGLSQYELDQRWIMDQQAMGDPYYQTVPVDTGV
ncbi:OCRE domain-containing protein [Natronorarus salvus]|uniref:OCRE domain-containing protein n=1 Tax=Natronorarus salvus TaxID=3117733 RepID=UPI002F2634F4